VRLFTKYESHLIIPSHKEGREKDAEAKKILDSKMEKMDNTG
jgi:hypothetical protein